MTHVILNFETEDGQFEERREGDIPVPRVGEYVHLSELCRVEDVTYDYSASHSVDYPEIWLTVSLVTEGADDG